MTVERCLIVNADDFGLSAGVNRGVIRAHDKGIVTSASLMVHMPAAAQAVALARSRPSLSLGLHVDIGEWYYENGRWIAQYQRALPNDLQALKAAVCAQLELFRCLTDTQPTHLDSHQHVHKREPIRSILCELAMELGVPLRHFHPGLSYEGAFYGQDGEGTSLSGRIKDSFLVEIIQTLNCEVTELCCHPAAEVDFRSHYSNERLQELEALCSPIVFEAIVRERVSLASFANI